MKLIFNLILLTGLIFAGQAYAKGKPSDLVNICHTPNGVNPITIMVADPALQVHLDHGDESGICCGGTTCGGGDQCETFTCENDVCVPEPVDCNDNNACTIDTCAANRGCIHTELRCSDGDVCTFDSCHPVTGCYSRPVMCPNDGISCTEDKCVAVGPGPGEDELFPVCRSFPDDAACKDTNNECTFSTCDLTEGCLSNDIADGLQCSDGRCVAGECDIEPVCPCTAFSTRYADFLSGVPTPLFCDSADLSELVLASDPGRSNFHKITVNNGFCDLDRGELSGVNFEVSVAEAAICFAEVTVAISTFDLTCTGIPEP